MSTPLKCEQCSLKICQVAFCDFVCTRLLDFVQLIKHMMGRIVVIVLLLCNFLLAFGQFYEVRVHKYSLESYRRVLCKWFEGCVLEMQMARHTIIFCQTTSKLDQIIECSLEPATIFISSLSVSRVALVGLSGTRTSNWRSNCHRWECQTSGSDTHRSVERQNCRKSDPKEVHTNLAIAVQTGSTIDQRRCKRHSKFYL